MVRGWFVLVVMMLGGTGLCFGEKLPEELQPLAPLIRNQGNVLGYPPGDMNRLMEVLQPFLRAKKKSQVIALLQTKPTVLKSSYGVYFLAMRYLQEQNVSVGLAMMHRAADQFLNPLAQIKLAQFYYHGPAVAKFFPKSGHRWVKDRERSFYYVTLAFQLVGVSRRYVKDRTLVNLVVRSGLGLVDSFHALSVQEKWDTRAKTKKLQPKINEKTILYKRLFHPSPTSRNGRRSAASRPSTFPTSQPSIQQ